MLNQFAQELLVATSMPPILGAVAVTQIAQDLPYRNWAPWLLRLSSTPMATILTYKIDLTTGQERIVFPAEKASAKKLLQFLNQKLFRGAITERLFETNSKRIAD